MPSGEQRPAGQVRRRRIDDRPPQAAEHGLELARRVPLDLAERPAAQDEVGEHHAGQVLHHRHRHGLDSDREPGRALAAVPDRVEEAGDEHDERGAEPGSRQHGQRLELGERAGAEQADRRGGDGRPRQHQVGAEPAGAKRRRGVGEGERSLDRRADRHGARLHELDRQDEQEHGRDEQRRPKQEVRGGSLDVPEDRTKVDVVPDLAGLVRDAELAVDLDGGTLHPRDIPVRLGHGPPQRCTKAASTDGGVRGLQSFWSAAPSRYRSQTARVNQPLVDANVSAGQRTSRTGQWA